MKSFIKNIGEINIYLFKKAKKTGLFRTFDAKIIFDLDLLDLEIFGALSYIEDNDKVPDKETRLKRIRNGEELINLILSNELPPDFKSYILFIQFINNWVLNYLENELKEELE
jgi:hypothetical protein